MADEIHGVPIGDLPGIESVPDDSLLVVEFLGKAYNMPGAVLKQLFQDILDAMGTSVDEVTEARLTAAIETVLASGKYNGVSPIVEVTTDESGKSVLHVVDASGIKDYPVEVQGASNAVQYVKQTLTPAQQKQARENIGATGGDLAVNDPNAPGYVANRTHWKELTGWAGELVPETTIEFTGTTNAITLVNVDEHGVEKSKPYTVTWNGVDYDCIGKDSGDGMYIGNGKLMDAYGLMGLPDTGEPFCLHALTEDIHTLYKRDKTAETITITVTARREAIYHPMEEGYIPEALRASVSYEPQALSYFQKVQARKNIEASVVVRLSGYPDIGYTATLDGKAITGKELDEMAETGANVIGISAGLSFRLPDGLTSRAVANGTVFRYENAVASRNPDTLESLSKHWFEFHAQVNGVDYGIHYDALGKWKGYAVSSTLTFMLTEADGQPKLSYNGQIMPNWAVIALLNMASYSNRPVFCFQKNMRFFKADGSVFIPAMYTPFSLMLSGAGEHIFFCEQDGYKYTVRVEQDNARSVGASPTAEKTVAYKAAESKADDLEVDNGELFLMSAGERIGSPVPLGAGPQGPPGESGVTTPVNGFFTLSVDSDGNLWAHSAEGGTTPDFEYDSETGNFYFITEE